ncbi:hypothetical protein HMI56_000456 [Coelomomyces lativittatus]|nr:hypothetical protein HMI56_000456 [Coelomomyces lativittatus]
MWTDEGQGGGRSPLALSARPSFQTYQVSSVPTPEEQIIAGPFQVKYLGPLETLREWKVYEDDLNVWIENLRVWLSRKLFQPLALEMKRVEQYLQLRDWAHLSFYNDVPAVDMAGTLSFPSSSSSSSSSILM